MGRFPPGACHGDGVSLGAWLPAILTMVISYLIVATTDIIPLIVPERSTGFNVARSMFLGAFITVSNFSLVMVVAAGILFWIPLAIQGLLGAMGGALFWRIADYPAEAST